MAISVGLQRKAKEVGGPEGAAYRAVAEALEVIPRVLVQNCGGNAIRTLTELRVSNKQSILLGMKFPRKIADATTR